MCLRLSCVPDTGKSTVAAQASASSRRAPSRSSSSWQQRKVRPVIHRARRALTSNMRPAGRGASAARRVWDVLSQVERREGVLMDTARTSELVSRKEGVHARGGDRIIDTLRPAPAARARSGRGAASRMRLSSSVRSSRMGLSSRRLWSSERRRRAGRPVARSKHRGHREPADLVVGKFLRRVLDDRVDTMSFAETLTERPAAVPVPASDRGP